jgi:subtilisin family serine protease
MCAFDAMIGAPECTLLDIAVLQSTAPGSTIMEGVLSDAVRAYAHLVAVASDPAWPYSALAVNNSWGMFHPSWDYPVGHPGNYSDNANHPFNRIVGTLERAGADILFAAGNCGRECPDGRCQGLTNAGVFGANSHPQVTCVAGVDTGRQRVGYSTSGPGRLMRSKPDVCGYTHFAGSGVYAADGGTSAATPVVAGLVAAVRTRLPYEASKQATHPAAMRWLLMRTADDLGTAGFDFDHGHGVVNGHKLATAVKILSVVKAVTRAAPPTPREVPTFASLGPSPVQPAEPRTRTAGAS